MENDREMSLASLELSVTSLYGGGAGVYGEVTSNSPCPELGGSVAGSRGGERVASSWGRVRVGRR